MYSAFQPILISNPGKKLILVLFLIWETPSPPKEVASFHFQPVAFKWKLCPIPTWSFKIARNAMKNSKKAPHLTKSWKLENIKFQEPPKFVHFFMNALLLHCIQPFAYLGQMFISVYHFYNITTIVMQIPLYENIKYHISCTNCAGKHKRYPYIGYGCNTHLICPTNYFACQVHLKPELYNNQGI